MNINNEISLETKLPFLTVNHFHMVWEINQHGELIIEGIAQSGSMENLKKQNDREINVKLILLENNSPLFSGKTESLDFVYESGITYIKAIVKSASIELDRHKLERVFQNPSLTITEIIKDVNGEEGGKVISTAGNKEIGRPFICYKETAWQFGQRLASHNGTYLIADVLTGRPHIWLGMRKGKEIKEEVSDSRIFIRKDYMNELGKTKKIYSIESRRSYSLGDWISLSGKMWFIYRKEAQFQGGELGFMYYLADSRDLKKERFYNEFITGISLWGTVRKTRKETLSIQLDIDKKSEGYFFPWRPETGNALYAMPEIGAKVCLYLPDCDEKNGICVGCMKQNTIEAEPENKYMRTSEGAELNMGSEKLEIEKNNEIVKVGDSSVTIRGSKLLIQAKGKIKMQSRNISLSAASEIRAVTD